VFELLFVVLPAALVALLSGERRFERELEALARAVGGNFFMDKVHLQHDGATIRFAYVRRRKQQVTEIEVDLPRNYPFALWVWPHADATLQIEGAPAAVASRFVDAPLRRLLERERSARLATPGGFVRLTLSRPFRGVADVRTLVEAMARIPARLREAYAEAEHALAGEHDGGPYREDPSGHDEREVRAAWSHEVEVMIAAHTLRKPS
jgi:hypothetical protein